MYRNNDVLREVANARRDDAIRWRQQEQRLREAGFPSLAQDTGWRQFWEP